MVNEFEDITENDAMVIFYSQEFNDIINCFDVSDDGYIAVSLSNRNINVYNESLEFVYAIDLEPNHSTQVISWEEKTLLIYKKDSVKVECISVYGLNDAKVYNIPETEKNIEIWQDIYQEKMRDAIEKNNYIYRAYDGKLVRINKDSEVEELITENSKVTELSWNFSGILFFISFIAAFIHDEYERSKRSKSKKHKKSKKEK